MSCPLCNRDGSCIAKCGESESRLFKGFTKEQHEEAAGMSLDDMFMAQHDQPCDCAVCDDIAFRRSMNISGVDAAIARHDEEVLVLKAQLITERLLGDKLICDRDAALSKAEFWRVSHDAACEDAKNWRRDAQELQGTLNDIMADLQGRRWLVREATNEQ